MDRYDRGLKYLLAVKTDAAFRSRIEKAWHFPREYQGGSLFLRCTPTGVCLQPGRDDGREAHWTHPAYCGCQTEVKAGQYPAADADLTAAIRADPNIPADWRDITRANLKHFVAGQRAMDKLWPGRLTAVSTADDGRVHKPRKPAV